MNRSELISALQQSTGLPRKEADWLVRQFFESIREGLKKDGRVELRGFGVFKVLSRNQAGFVNPRDGRYYGGMTLKTIKFYPSSATRNEAF